MLNLFCNQNIQKVLGNYDRYAERIRKIKVNNPETQIIVALVYGSNFHITRPHTKFRCKMEKQMANQVEDGYAAHGSYHLLAATCMILLFWNKLQTYTLTILI